jgi:hypothetical protein
MRESLLSSLPFALAAAFYPAGFLTIGWMLSRPRGLRRALSYLAGAGASTFGSGVVIVTLMHRAGRPSWLPGLHTAVETGMGAVLVAVAAWLVARKPSLWSRTQHDEPTAAGGMRRAFLLGVVMWMPSLAYVAALERIVATDAGSAVVLVELVLMGVVVLSSIEVPLLLYAVAPGHASRAIRAITASLPRLGWPIASTLAGLGGVYLLAHGWGDIA